MNILVLNWRDPFHPLAGGAEVMLFEHSKAWHKKGAKVTWFAASFKGAKRTEELNGIQFIRYGNQYTVHVIFFIMALFGKYRNIDIVIDCFHFIPYFSILFLKHLKIIALIHEVAGVLWFSNINKPFARVGYLLEPFFIRLYKKKTFITVSDSTRKELIRLGIPPEKANVIYNGISPLAYTIKQAKSKKPIIIFLGRLSVDKGIKDTLMAFQIIYKSVKDIQLIIIGKEEVEGDYKKIINEAKLSHDYIKNIHFKGYVSEKEKYIYLAKAWLLLHPSIKEGWGLSVIEAGSQRTPTIGYDTEGLRDTIIHNKTGILVNKNYHDLAHACIELLTDYKKRTMLGEEAYDYSKRFTWEVAAEKSWEVLQKQNIC